jgi:outer membrane receptor protein involved in Fe transport
MLEGVERSSIANGLQADGSYVLTPTHTLRAGVMFSAERTNVQTLSSVLPAVSGIETSDQPFRIFDSEGTTGYAYGGYLQDEWRVVPSVTVNGGLRFDDLEAFTSERQLSPRLTVVWEATPTTTVHAGYARYFTPPRQELVSTATINRFVNTTNESPVAFSSPPRAERANYYDVGVVQHVTPGFRVGLDGYYKESEYQLDEGQFGAPVFLTPFNYRRARNLGVELTISYTIGNFSGYGNLAAAQQEAKGIATSQALFSPEDRAYIDSHHIVTDHSQLITASAGLAYLWNRTRLSLDLLAGSGLRRTVVHPNDATNPPYQQLNVGISRRFTLPALGNFEARFDVINVLDNNYVIRDGTGVGVFAKQFGPPRGFFGGLKKEF